MPTAQEILNSDAESVIVFEVTLDNTEVNTSPHYEWAGGDSALAHTLGAGEIKDNSYYAMSNGVVDGLATNEVIMGDFHIEKSLGKPFEGGADYSIGNIEIEFQADAHEFHLRDWEDKPFTISVGYKTDVWGSYQTLVTGKTIGHTLSGHTMKVSLSVNPVGTDKLYPTETYTTGDSRGRAKPYIFGTVNKIKPVPTDEANGTWEFHNGTPQTNDSEINYTPTLAFNKSEGIALGGFRFNVYTATTDESTYAFNDFPADLVDASGAYAKTLTDHIQLKIPNATSQAAWLYITSWKSGEDKYSIANVSASDVPPYTVEFDVVLDDTSGLDSWTPPGNIHQTITKGAVRTIRSRSDGSQSGRCVYGSFDLSTTAAPGGTVVINVLAARLVFNTTSGNDVQAYDAGGRKKIPTLRVNDAGQTVSVHEGAAFYDDSGVIRVNPETGGFVVDAVGEDADIKSIAAAQEISTAANGTLSPVTASFTGDAIGHYVTEQKPLITHIRDIVRPLDCFVEPEIDTNDLEIKRRYNHQPTDFDGVTNNVTAFTFEAHEIIEGSVVKQTGDVPVSRYTAIYKLDHSNQDQSPTETDFNQRGHLNQRKQIVTPLRTSTPAAEIAGLASRDGNRRPRYGFKVNGVGHDLGLSTVGTVTHPYIHKGKFEIRKVRENLMKKETYIEGVVYV